MEIAVVIAAVATAVIATAQEIAQITVTAVAQNVQHGIAVKIGALALNNGALRSWRHTVQVARSANVNTTAAALDILHTNDFAWCGNRASATIGSTDGSAHSRYTTVGRTRGVGACHWWASAGLTGTSNCADHTADTAFGGHNTGTLGRTACWGAIFVVVMVVLFVIEQMIFWDNVAVWECTALDQLGRSSIVKGFRLSRFGSGSGLFTFLSCTFLGFFFLC